MTDEKSLLAEARKQAMHDARTQAEQVAALAGVKITGVKSVEEMRHGASVRPQPELSDVVLRVQMRVVFATKK